jgi:carbamoyltransferase
VQATILGISAFYHDSAAAIVRDGEVIAAAQEERFSRVKFDAAFPTQAASYCLREAGVSLSEVDYVVFYDKPLITFERLLETYLAFAPRGLSSFVLSMAKWGRESVSARSRLEGALALLSGLARRDLPPLLFEAHHMSHAASAFFASPFDRAAILCLDGVGEWATTSVWLGEHNRIVPQWEIGFPHSLGLLYSAFTYHTGFRVDSDEYKLMGLAPFGEPRHVDTILRELVDVADDGTFRLHMRCFDFATGRRMTNRGFDTIFGREPRRPGEPLTQDDMDMARSIQVVIEEVLLRLARTVQRELGIDRLCMAGGVALNCVANGRLAREGPFRELWIQPAAGDAGGALGAALSVWHHYLEQPRRVAEGDAMKGARLGPSFDETALEGALTQRGLSYERLDDEALFERVAQRLGEGGVVGWFRGRMEYGPRALGGRSILADARDVAVIDRLNRVVKQREGFRPFAPMVKEESAHEWFSLSGASPYMLLTAPVHPCRRIEASDSPAAGVERIHTARSTIAAVTHVDGSARVQTIGRGDDALWPLLDRFEAASGVPVLVNTSFNGRDEPIVCTPEDALDGFAELGLDALAMGPFYLERRRQPAGALARRAPAAPRASDAGNPRRFGLLAALWVGLFGVLLPWWLDRSPWGWWPSWLAALLALTALLMPQRLRPLHAVARRVGKVLAEANTWLLLGLVFFLMVTPLAFLSRLVGRDALRLRWARGHGSYREVSRQRARDHLEHPY